MSFFNFATIDVDYNWIVQLKPHPGWHCYWNYLYIQIAWSRLGPDEYFNLVENSDNVHLDYSQCFSVLIRSCFLHYGHLDGNPFSVRPCSSPNYASNLQHKFIWTFRNGNSCWTHHLFLHLSRHLHRRVVIHCLEFQTRFRRISTIARYSRKFPISDQAINWIWTAQDNPFYLAENKNRNIIKTHITYHHSFPSKVNKSKHRMWTVFPKIKNLKSSTILQYPILNRDGNSKLLKEWYTEKSTSPPCILVFR